MKQTLIIIYALINVAIAQQPLSISTDKTTSPVFPLPIKYVGKGTEDMLVHPVKENDNILLIKAASKQFSGAYLSIVTADGNVYTFTVNYSPAPAELSFHLPPNKKANIATYASSIINNKPRRILKVAKYNVIAKVTGIYIRDDVIYYELEICNHSPIEYDIDLLPFVIRDKKKSRLTAIQDIELTPLYIAGNSRQVKAYKFSVIVVALDKFTISDAKLLGVRIMEKNGGRHFNQKIYNNHI